MTLADCLIQTQTITIETATREGLPIATPIWGVVVDDACYVRSGYGDAAAWYRRLRRTWLAAIVGPDQRYSVRVERVVDEHTRKLVDDAYRGKYRGQGIALCQALASPARDYTLRLIPDES